MSAEKKRLIRFDVWVRRHPSLTSEEFHHKWTHEHAALIKDWLARHGVLRYTQFHTPPEMREQFLGVRDDASVLNFDGCGEILMENLDGLKAMTEDPYYAEVVKPHEDMLLDTASVTRTVGYEEVWVRDGKVVAAPAE